MSVHIQPQFTLFLYWNADGLHFRMQRNTIQSISPSLTSFWDTQIKKQETYLVQTTVTIKEERKIYSLFGLMVKALDSQSTSPVFKTPGCLQGRLSFSSFRGRSNE